jgi:predicted flavoprotein YhiN
MIYILLVKQSMSGHLWDFSFQWAWASGVAASEYV